MSKPKAKKPAAKKSPPAKSKTPVSPATSQAETLSSKAVSSAKPDAKEPKSVSKSPPTTAKTPTNAGSAKPSAAAKVPVKKVSASAASKQVAKKVSKADKAAVKTAKAPVAGTKKVLDKQGEKVAVKPTKPAAKKPVVESKPTVVMNTSLQRLVAKELGTAVKTTSEEPAPWAPVWSQGSTTQHPTPPAASKAVVQQKAVDNFPAPKTMSLGEMMNRANNVASIISAPQPLKKNADGTLSMSELLGARKV